MVRKYSFGRLVMAIGAMALAVAVAVRDVAMDFIETMISVVSIPNEFRFDDLNSRSDLLPSGAPLDAALQHDMRHEAGVSKRAAPRHV